MSTKLAIYTRCTSRWFYLKRQLESLDRWEGASHKIFVQHGAKIPAEVEEFVSRHGAQIESIPWVTLSSASRIGQNWALGTGAELIMQLDDDARAMGPDFFQRIYRFHEAKPDVAFAPAVVGIFATTIRSPDSSGKDRHYVYDPHFDEYYGYRIVRHIGGFARAIPSRIAEKVNIPDGDRTEDGTCSGQLNQLGVPRVYLENGVVVEHQETTWGQHRRREAGRM